MAFIDDINAYATQRQQELMNFINSLPTRSYDNATKMAQSADAYSQIARIREQLPLIQKAIGSGYITDSSRDLALKAVQGDATSLQGIQEMIRSGEQIDKQKVELTDFRNRAETQFFGKPGATLEEALSSTTGDIGQLGNYLKNQQSDIFRTELAPLTNMSLNAQGLLNSGANVELQSKALAGLERGRQDTLMGAALGYRGQMQGLERSDILGNIGAQQQALTNLSEIQRAGITMEFQRQLEDRRAQLAKELSQYRGGGSSPLGGILGGGAQGAMIGGSFGGPWGAAIGFGLGGLLGGLNSSQGGSAIYGR